MKAIVLLRRAATEGRINEYHITLFHGNAEVADRGWLSGSRMLGNDISQPLQLSRNAWRMPDVFQPGLTLIVSSRVRDVLASVPHIKLQLVQFKKLVNMAFQAGDFSYFQSREFRSDPWYYAPDNLIDRLPDTAELHEDVGTYYELLVSKGHEVNGPYEPLTLVRFPLDPRDPDGEEARISASLLEDYPIIWDGRVIFSERAFALIEPFIDREYFWTWETEV